MTIDQCAQCKFLKAVRLTNHTNYSWFCTRDRDSADLIRDLKQCKLNNKH